MYDVVSLGKVQHVSGPNAFVALQELISCKISSALEDLQYRTRHHSVEQRSYKQYYSRYMDIKAFEKSIYVRCLCEHVVKVTIFKLKND
jgi:hypothetical protein